MNVDGFISDRFQFLNDSGNKKEANGMLSVYIEQGARESLLREVLKIGSEKYKKVLHNVSLGIIHVPLGIDYASIGRHKCTFLKI
jgi:hypothetical protein